MYVENTTCVCVCVYEANETVKNLPTFKQTHISLFNA